MVSKKQRALLGKIYNKKRGAYFKMQYSKSLANKTLAKYKDKYLVTKITTISIRTGIRYDTLKSVIERRKSNLSCSPYYNTRKPWFHHIDRTLVKHNTKDEYYVMVFPNKFGKPTTQYFVNGKPVTTEELRKLNIMQPSYWTSREEKPECMTINISDIVEVF